MQLRRYRASLEIFSLAPAQQSREFASLVTFLAQVKMQSYFCMLWPQRLLLVCLHERECGPASSGVAGIGMLSKAAEQPFNRSHAVDGTPLRRARAVSATGAAQSNHSAAKSETAFSGSGFSLLHTVASLPRQGSASAGFPSYAGR